MDRITLADAWKVIVETDPALWLGVLAGIIVFVIEFQLYKKGLIFSGEEKKLERARNAGHVIPATMIKCRYEDRDSSGKTANRQYIATYEYTALEKVRTARVVTVGTKPPHKISLYYDTNPGKVFSEYDCGPSRWGILLYIIPLVAAVLVMKMLGFEG